MVNIRTSNNGTHQTQPRNLTMETKFISVAETAKLIRAALKKAFPTVKFAVRSKKYAGGASINVSWTDGPTAKQVEAITGQFQSAGFDGSIDFGYSVSHW